MPYIKPELREDVDKPIEWLIDEIRKYEDADKDGLLNYCISRIVAGSFGENNRHSFVMWSYKAISRAVAVFEAAKLEFYNRVGTPHENKARVKNGDIPEYRSE